MGCMLLVNADSFSQLGEVSGSDSGKRSNCANSDNNNVIALNNVSLWTGAVFPSHLLVWLYLVDSAWQHGSMAAWPGWDLTFPPQLG